MIGAVVKVGLLRIWHARVPLLLDFAVPIAFFTIFAAIFGGQVGLGRSPRVNVALVDEDATGSSRELLGALAGEDTLRVYSAGGRARGPAAFAEAGPAQELVRQGALPLAVVVPRGWAKAFAEAGEDAPRVRILTDSTDPVATRVVSALVRQAAGRIRAEQARRQIESALGPAAAPFAAAAARFARPVGVEVEEVLAAGKANPVVSMYAAGIAVMFLLFAAVGGAGTLLEEEESQTLERLMCTGLGMGRLLAGKWLLLTLVGVLQATVMFAWAQLVFGVDLVGHLAAFAVMTIVTAGAASSLALALAAACRTRAQLNAVAIVLILTMSALGGSMVPRYVMSGTMREIGRLTFNAWALDGYTKVFWRGMGVPALLPEVAVLAATALALFLLARRLARRWESV